jgi:hypothetical protein
MKIRVNFKAIGSMGRIEHKTISFTCPDFKEIVYVHSERLKGIPLTVNLNTTVICQVVDWLDNMDKRDIMDENDWSIILDYNILARRVQSKKKRELALRHNTAFELAQRLIVDNVPMLNDFEVTYNRMADTIKGIPIAKQFEIVLKAMNIGMETASVAYRRISAILNDKNPDDVTLEPKNKIISKL